MDSGLGCGVLACSTGLLVAVQRCAAPANEAGGVFGGAALSTGVLGDREFVRDDGGVGQRPAEACAVLACGGDAGIDPLDDELALILGKGCEHVQHQPAGRGCRVDAIGDGPDLDTAAAQ